MEKSVEIGASPVSMTSLPFSPRAKNVLELAMWEAGQLGHDYIGTEHLLLGLIRENEGIAAQVLKAQNLELQDTRAQVVELGGESGARTADDDDSKIVGSLAEIGAGLNALRQGQRLILGLLLLLLLGLVYVIIRGAGS
ncbi:MAG: Clp protease N-terminal domain-containing protein [Planctomycetota bacterium]